MQRSAGSADGLQDEEARGPAGDPDGADAHAPPPESRSGADELHQAASSWGQELRVVWNTFLRALDLQRRELALRAFDAALGASQAAAGALIALLLAGCATLLLVAGARRGLAAWSGGAWWSDLVLGAALIALLFGGLKLVQKAKHRSALRQAQRTLAPGALAGGRRDA